MKKLLLLNRIRRMAESQSLRLKSNLSDIGELKSGQLACIQ